MITLALYYYVGLWLILMSSLVLAIVANNAKQWSEVPGCRSDAMP
jgi:hypothetical protein